MSYDIVAIAGCDGGFSTYFKCDTVGRRRCAEDGIRTGTDCTRKEETGEASGCKKSGYGRWNNETNMLIPH